MKTLIVGAEGQLGSFLLRELAGTHEVWGTSAEGADDLPRLDIRDAEQVRSVIRHVAPDEVFLTAAMTHVDKCEIEPELAKAINVQGTENVARACRETGAGLTFFSSDYVFDGEHGPYAEDDPVHPLSVYGRTKWEGEQCVADLVPRHRIIRTMVVYSYLLGSKNLYMQVLERLRNHEPLSGPGDQWVHPTQAVNLARVVRELAEVGARGVYHVAGTTWLPRDEFMRRIVASWDGDANLVQTQRTVDLKQYAPRPLKSGLKTDKVRAVLTRESLWDLDQALAFTRDQASS